MDVKHTVNECTQQESRQVVELGTATELTWGPAGSHYEGPMCNPRPSHWGRTVALNQITEIGKATNLTLGQAGKNFE